MLVESEPVPQWLPQWVFCLFTRFPLSLFLGVQSAYRLLLQLIALAILLRHFVRFI